MFSQSHAGQKRVGAVAPAGLASGFAKECNVRYTYLIERLEGSVVRFYDRSGKFMRKETITCESGEPRSYILESGGQAYRRNP